MCRRGSRVQEAFVAHESIVKWRSYLRHSPRTFLHTDHQSLLWLLTTKHELDEVNEWALHISQFVNEGDIQWRPGAQHTVPDALSRMYQHIRFSTSMTLLLDAAPAPPPFPTLATLATLALSEAPRAPSTLLLEAVRRPGVPPGTLPGADCGAFSDCCS